MSRKPIEMRKIREILRLKWSCNCSHRAIAQSIRVSDSTVSECLKRAKMANISWPLPDELSDEALENTLYPPAQKLTSEQKGDLNFETIHKELKRKGVTLYLLWQEYKTKYPTGISYSRFCYVYRQWMKKKEVWMHQTYKAGEKMLVDYAGQTVSIADANTGEIKEAQIFVAVLGASHYIFVEATWTQSLPDWITSHIHAFEFFGGCSEIVVIDNLRSGVKKAHRYEPELNRTYQEMALHYGVAIIPTRIRSPRDKGAVENAVLVVERSILAVLRNRTFFSLTELNYEIALLREKLNKKSFQKLQGSRWSQFHEIDKPALRPLPLTRYEYAVWKKVKAGCNYHVEIEHHHYSVPFTVVKEELYARITHYTVEIFHNDQRIASHVRHHIHSGYTTNQAHMPSHHQFQAAWTPARLVSWAEKIGPETVHCVQHIMASRQHPEQGFRACLGILRFEKGYGKARLEAACKRAHAFEAYNYKSIESILKNNLDQQPLPNEALTEHAKPTMQNHE